MSSRTGSSGTAAFSQALAALKRRGSCVLLVGAACEGAHVEASRRLLGEADGDRRRLFVFTDGEPDVDRRLPEGPPAGDGVRVVDATRLTRGAAVAATPTDAPTTLGAADAVVAPGDLVGLGNEVSEAIDEMEAAAGGLAPAQFRLCFDSVGPLLEDHDEPEVFRFLHAATGDVRRVRGMGHFHLPVDADDRVARTLAPLFDAVVELRTAPGGDHQQRWTVREGDLRTGWLPL